MLWVGSEASDPEGGHLQLIPRENVPVAGFTFLRTQVLPRVGKATRMNGANEAGAVRMQRRPSGKSLSNVTQAIVAPTYLSTEPLFPGTTLNTLCN